MTKLAALAIALTALTSGANARETYVKMPEFLIGSWCKSDDSGSDTSFWNVNSMVRAGRRDITKCVLVSSWDFTLEGETEANDRSCYAVNVGPIGKDTAPSGTHYQVAITARCYKDGVPFAEQKTKLEVFKFVNYKH
jgi:hypothetical protein